LDRSDANHDNLAMRCGQPPEKLCVAVRIRSLTRGVPAGNFSAPFPRLYLNDAAVRAFRAAGPAKVSLFAGHCLHKTR
jgi:hypothetical protein